MPLLPPDALHVLAEQLDEGDLEQALVLLKLFIILCRWVVPRHSPLQGGRAAGDLGANSGVAYSCDTSRHSLLSPAQEPRERGGGLGPGVGAPGAGFAEEAVNQGEVGPALREHGGGGEGVARAQLTPSALSWYLQLKGAPGSQEGQGPQLESVALHALLLCEGLFDPYQTWRRQHSG